MKFAINFLLKFFLKKGGRVFLPPFFVFLVCCSGDLSRYGKVSLHNTADKKSFVFSVNEGFLKNNQDSPVDKVHNKMSKAEAGLLTKLLKEKKYCFNSDNKFRFEVSSKQEKIYDMTFAHLIEENYNARPISPRMYFGRCVD